MTREEALILALQFANSTGEAFTLLDLFKTAEAMVKYTIEGLPK